jgi:8-oxo-dGTP pyrophosphatase MutT (NUDIX family)
MFDPLSDAVAGGLAAAAGDRVALGAALEGAAVGDATAALCVGVSDRVALACGVELAGTGDDVAVPGGLVDAGEADAPPSVAHALVSCVSTERHTDRALESHEVPSAAVRESERRMNG